MFFLQELLGIFMDIGLVLQVVVAGASLMLAVFTTGLMFSRRLRLRLVRGLMGDWAMLKHMSDAGKLSGESKFNKKVEGIIQKNIPRFLGEIVTDNPLAGRAVEWFVNETELSDLIEDPRLIGAVMQYMTKGGTGIDLSSLFNGVGLSPQQKQDINGGFRIG